MPPRHGKSELVSRHFPSWYLGTFPERDVILCSATEDLALDFSETGRRIMGEYGEALFDTTLRSDTKSKQLWKTTNGGSLRAAGVGGSIMGRGAHMLIIDDYFKNVEDCLSENQRTKLHQWYHSTSSTRLMPGAFVVIVCTRWHADDLVGRLLHEARHGGKDRWLVIRLPALAEENDPLDRDIGEALWPDQWSKEELLRRKAQYEASGYHWMWLALYQQIPPTVLDAEFSPEYFSESDYFSVWPTQKMVRWRSMALDPSLGKTDKSDYSAFTWGTLGDDGTMHVDADLDRRDSVKICEDGLKLVRKFRPHALFVESVSFQEVLQTSFERMMREQGIYVTVYGLNNREAKRSRIRATLTPHLAQHRFKWAIGSGGCALMLDQLKQFPTAKFDDGPDSLEMLVRSFEFLCENGVQEGLSDTNIKGSENIWDMDISFEDLGLPASSVSTYVNRSQW